MSGSDSAEGSDEMKQLFDLFDINKDGLVTLDEMLQVMEWLGEKRNPVEVETMFNLFDTNKNGTLEFDEFSDIITLITEPDKGYGVRIDYLRAFNYFDRDKDGFITASDLRVTMQELGEDVTARDIREMLGEAKLDKRGRMDFKSFKRLLKGLDIDDANPKPKKRKICVLL